MNSAVPQLAGAADADRPEGGAAAALQQPGVGLAAMEEAINAAIHDHWVDFCWRKENDLLHP